MKKLIVLAIAVVLSLSLVWAADSVNGTKKMTLKIKPANNIQKVEPILKGLPNGSPQALESTSPKQAEPTTVIDPGANREGTEIPALAPAAKPSAEAAPGQPGYVGLGYDKEAAAKQEALRNPKTVQELIQEVAFEAPKPTKAEKDAAALSSPTILDFLQQAAEQPEAISAPYVEEPKWEPQYGEKGELLNPVPMIRLDGQNGAGIPGGGGIILVNKLTQDFEGTWTAGLPPGGWSEIDSGTEGTQNLWWVDKWHKFYYNASGWYDTCLASMWSTAYVDSMQSTWAITPSFDLSAATTCTLFLKEYYDNVSTTTDSANVMVSLDNGSTWARVRTFKADSTTTRVRSVVLTPYVGPANTQVKVGFWHNYGPVSGSPSATNGWVIDDVRVKVDGTDLWTQTFSNQMSGWFGNTPPSSWSINSNGSNASRPKAWNNNDWYKRASALGGSAAAAITYVGSNARREWENDWLFSPACTLSTSVACTLSFAQLFSTDNMGNQFPPNTNYMPHYGYVKIQETTDNGVTWGPWTNIDVYNNAQKGLSTPKVYFKYDISSWSGKAVRIAFQQVNNPDNNFGYWYIDDVKIDDYVLATDNVGTMANVAPVLPVQGRNNVVKTRVFNNGSNAETFQDSVYFEQLNKNILFLEEFGNPQSWTGANPPVNPVGTWAVLDSGTCPSVWGVEDWKAYYYSAWLDTVAYAVWSSSCTNKAHLITPAVSVGTAANVHLNLHLFYDDYTGSIDSLLIWGTPDNWTTKYLIAKYKDADYTGYPDFDISSWAVGASSIKIDFEYDANNAMACYVDEVQLYESLAPTVVYQYGETVTSMPALSTQVVTQTNTWNNPTPGTYNMRSFTTLAGDGNAADNQLTTAVTAYAHTGAIGPDGGGYTLKDDINGGGPAYNWIDISTTGTPIYWNFGTGHARYTAGLGLGFPFWYYGQTKSRIYLSEDGYMTFDSLTSTYSTNYNFPYSSAPNNLIGFFWDDLIQSTGDARFWTNNVDTAIVSFTNWGIFATGDTLPIKFDAQVIFSKNDAKIKMQYRKFEPGLTLSHSIGIENAAGTAGLQYVYNAVPMGNLPIPPLAITFTPPTDDIMASSLVSPGTFMSTGRSYSIEGRFKNVGVSAQTFDVRMVINDGSSDVFDVTQTGLTLNSGDSVTVTFGNYTPVAAGTLTFTQTVTNPGDENTANDVLVTPRTVYLHEGVGGPDAGNYSWKDNTVIGGPTFTWVDMSAATPITWSNGTLDDGWTNGVTMSSPFFFYGTMQSTVWFCTNGFATFDSIATFPTYLAHFPDPGTPQNIIGFMRSDMYARTGGLTILDDIANNRFVIQLDSIYFYNTPSQSFDCQIILDRDDSTVVIQYDNFGPSYQTDAAVGIENGTGTIGLEYYYNATLLAGLGNYPYNGLAMKFYYVAPAADVGMASFDAPNGMLFFGTPYTIQGTAQNYTVNAATFDVEFYADAVLVGTLVGVNLPGLGFTSVSCPNTWSPATTGDHTLQIKTVYPPDTTPANDMITVTRTVLGALVTPPFSTDFEADNGGFVVGAGEWEWGIPTEAIGPPSAHSPVNLWGVDLDNTYDPSTLNTLYSAPLDLTGLAAPTVRFWMWYYLESGYDGANLKVSNDNGLNWSVITTSVPYNQVGNSSAPGIAGQPVWSGSAGWTEVIVSLAAYAGQTVILRFDQSAESSVQYAGLYIDDFSFYEPPANDVGVSTILAPGSITIQGFSWAVRSRVHNFGAAMQLNVPVTFEIRDILYNLVYTDSKTLTQIEPGADSTIEFTAWSPAEPDTHRIASYTANPGDANVANDTAHATTYTYTHVGNGGPVANYTFADNVNGGGPAFNWIDISSLGTNIFGSNIDDGNSGFIPIGMTFKFFGVDYTQLAVCTNGWLSFIDATSTDYTESVIPDADGPGAMVALLWDDMSTRTGHVWYYYDAIENQFIVQFDSVEYLSPAGSDIGMEVILDGDDNSIKMQYLYFAAGSQTDCTVGIENAAETVALPYDNNGEIGQTPLAGVAITWTYTPPPIPDYTVSALGVPTDVFAAHGRVGVHGYYSATVSDLNGFGGTADVTLNIFDPFLMLVHTETVNGVLIPSSGDIVVPFPSGYTPAVNGAFTLEAIVSSIDDPNPANNTFTRPMDVSPVQDAYYYNPASGFSAYNAASGWVFAQMYTALGDGYITNADIYLGAFSTGGDVHFYYWPIVDGVPDLANPLLDLGTMTIPPGFWIVSLDLTGSEIPVSAWDSVAVGFQNDPINPCDVSGVFETPGQGYEVYRDFINVGGTWFDNQDNSNYGWDMYFDYLNPSNPEVATVPTSFSEILPVNSVGNFGFTLFNLGASGTPDLNWSASSGDGWIQNITPASGTLPAVSNTAVTFDINTAGLVPYTNYSGSIVITSNDPLSPYTLPVSLYTATTPALGLAESGNFTDIAVSNHGVLGDYDVQNYTYNWGGTGAVDYGGTLLLGNSGSAMLLEYGIGTNNNDYRATEPLDMTDTFHPTGAFDDGGTLYGGLSVAYSGEGFHTGLALADSGDFFFHKYVITNNTGAPINGLLTGLYFDWDIGPTDIVTFDRSRNLIIQNKAGGPYYGISLLSGNVNTLMGVSQQLFIYDQQGWIAETLFVYMNQNADLLPQAYADMSSMVSFGPFDLGVGESIPVAFAVIGGATAQDVADGADMAFSIYTGVQPCVYIPGDINGTGIINGVQVSYGVNYFKGFGPPPPFICPDCPNPGDTLFATGDVNGTCEFNGVDIQYYINYFKVAGPEPTFCPACPPGGAAPAVVKPGLKVKATNVGGAE